MNFWYGKLGTSHPVSPTHVKIRNWRYLPPLAMNNAWASKEGQILLEIKSSRNLFEILMQQKLLQQKSLNSVVCIHVHTHTPEMHTYTPRRFPRCKGWTAKVVKHRVRVFFILRFVLRKQGRNVLPRSAAGIRESGILFFSFQAPGNS